MNFGVRGMAWWCCCLAAALVGGSTPRGAGGANTPPLGELKLVVGEVRQLEGAGPEAAGAAWSSSQPRVASVYRNGFVVALRPGICQIQQAQGGRRVVTRTVTVTRPEEELCDPESLQQFPDNRAFTSADGRRCVGTELNGKLVGNVQDPPVDRNRVLNPAPLRDDHPLLWQVEPDTPLLDGTGTVMGTIVPSIQVNGRAVPACKFNYGMSKVIDGRLHLYAFAVEIRPDARLRPLLSAADARRQRVSTSGWLPLERVVRKELLLEHAGIGRGKLPRLPLEDQRFAITGGDPQMYLTDGGEELSIVKTLSGAVPSHYLRRPSGTVNIIYCVPGFALGGQSLDSLLITSRGTFRAARGVRPITVPTYYPKGHARAGEVADKTMTFLYGAVEAPGTEIIYGWIAREALAPVPRPDRK